MFIKQNVTIHMHVNVNVWLTFTYLVWHISSMVHRCYKDYCVPLVGLCCCSYYSTYHILRQFESVKELFMMKVPSTLWHLPIGSWVRLVRLGHATGWRKVLFLLDTSIPLRGISNGWRMTWSGSGLWGMRKLTWRLARKQGGLSDHLDMPHILLFYTLWFSCFCYWI